MAKPNKTTETETPDATTPDAPIVGPIVYEIDDSATVTVPARFKVRSVKGVVFDVDLTKTPDATGLAFLMGRGLSRMAGDVMAPKEAPEGGWAATVQRRVSAWVAAPEQTRGPRGESDPFLNAARDLARSAGKMKAADARTATLPMIQAAFGTKWAAAEALIQKRVAENEALAMME